MNLLYSGETEESRKLIPHTCPLTTAIHSAAIPQNGVSFIKITNLFAYKQEKRSSKVPGRTITF